jgi:5-(carboxyamino)imidazole ribonucleotide synthase
VDKITSIGIIGGGQLGKMLAEAAKHLPFPIAVGIYDAAPDACAATVCDIFLQGAFSDAKAIQQFASSYDVITYEFENISATTLEGLPHLPQGTRALHILQNRLREKQFINQLPGIPTVTYASIDDTCSLSYPYVIKTTEFGYDGKGQQIIRSDQDLHLVSKGMIGEQYLGHLTEYSVILARSITGEITHFPVLENTHVNQILDTSQFAEVPEEMTTRMVAKTVAIAEALNYYGVLTVEFFSHHGELFVNEVAPRVHNSGHITLDATNVSQFDLHLYCLLGIPLPEIITDYSWCMVNVLGQHYEAIRHTQIPAKFYDYGKHSTRHNRKVGHINGKLEHLELIKEVRNG